MHSLIHEAFGARIWRIQASRSKILQSDWDRGTFRTPSACLRFCLVMTAEGRHGQGPSANGNWCLIESDPGVFTELMRGFGKYFSYFGEVHRCWGLGVRRSVWSKGNGKHCGRSWINFSVQLGGKKFRWWKNCFGSQEKWNILCKTSEYHSNSIISKVITNACATQAIINILMNIADGQIQLGQTLLNFKSFVEEFDSTVCCFFLIIPYRWKAFLWAPLSR